MPTTPPQLLRRLSRRIDQGKGIMLSPEELDILVISGAYEVLAAFATEHLKELARQRLTASTQKSSSDHSSFNDEVSG
jgi:hypothetical protein